MAQLVEQLPHMHEDLTSIPSNHINSYAIAIAHACDSRTVEVGR